MLSGSHGKMNSERHPDDRIIAALWIGAPKSVEEEGRLYHGLIAKLDRDPDAPGPMVTSDEEPVPIKELIETLTGDSLFIESAASQAQKKGLSHASMGVLVFSATGRALWPDYPPDGELTYLDRKSTRLNSSH